MVRLAILSNLWLGASLFGNHLSQGSALPQARDHALQPREPTPDVLTDDRSIVERQDSRTQQMGQQLANIIIAFVDACRAGQLETMAEWTKQYSMELKQAYPYKNVMVVHPKHSHNFVGSTHDHFELNMPCAGWGTRGYEIYVFDYGEFWLNGDRGYENWAFAGNYEWDPDNNGNYVRFNTIERPPSIPTLPTPTPPGTPVRQNPDGNYLVNCWNTKTNVISSGIAYYKNMQPLTGGNINRLPDDYVDVSHGWYHTWESGFTGVRFPSSGVSVWLYIVGGTKPDTLNENVGFGTNGYVNWRIYTGRRSFLYNVRDGDGQSSWNCYDIYFLY